MHRYTRLLLTTLIATTALAAAVSGASARNVSVSNQSIRAVWSSLELSNTITSEIVRCPVTLEGSFTSATIAKVLHALIGVISRASVANPSCTGGHATIHQETLPWRLTYVGFTGILPRITSWKLLLIRSTFEISTARATCTAETEEEHPATGIATTNENTGEVNNLEAEPGARIPLRGGLCALGSGSFAGSAAVTLLGTTNKITIRLI
jgi:hypothetical protein